MINLMGLCCLQTDKSFANLGITAGKKEWGHGLQVRISKHRIESFDMALWLSRKDSRLVLKQEQLSKSYGNTRCSFYHRVSEDVQFAGEYHYDSYYGDSYMQMGGEWRYDAKTSLKGKMDTEGAAALALHRQLGPRLWLNTALRLDVLRKDNHAFAFTLLFQ